MDMIETLSGGRYGDAVSDALAFPLSDPVGSAVLGVEIPGRQVIAELVAPEGTEVEASGVRRSTIDALASAGLLGRPLAPAAAQRELAELLAGSDASTWFCWAQHFTPLRILEANNPTYALLPALRTADVFSAVAFAHVRRPGDPNPAATRVPGGWQLDGTLDWVTSWDITDVVMVMARGTGADSESLVCVFLPAGRSSSPAAGVEPGERLSLLAMGGTHTRPVRLDGVHVPDEHVGAILDRSAWLAADARTSADANPAIFGVTRGALGELAMLSEQRSDAELAAVVEALAAQCREIRQRAYDAVDDPDAPTAVKLRTRAEALGLVQRATTAVVVARAGAAIRSGQPAERRAREALFLQVQAQTAQSRRATLDRLGR